MVKMDGNGRQCDTPREVDAKKPFDNPHKTKQGLDGRIFREVDEVVNVKSQRERMFRRTVGGVLWISDETGVKARVFQRRGETNRKKNSIDFVLPVPRTATEAIKCFKE